MLIRVPKKIQQDLKYESNLYLRYYMLTFNLDYESEVMTAIHTFVDYVLNHEMSSELFISSLEQLIPAFNVFYQNDVISYNSTILAFQEVVQSVDGLCQGHCYADVLPRLTCAQLKALRAILLRYRADVIHEIESFQRQEYRNQKEFLSYVQSIIQDHYKVLIVRVDFAYLKHSIEQVSIQTFYGHIEQFCRRLKDKNGCFKYLLGYGIALEQGVTKGYHAHLMLIYNGSERQQDEYLAQQVLQLWHEISSGLGSGFNLHTKEYKDNYRKSKKLGIGMIHRDKMNEVKNALDVAKYHTQPEKYAQSLRLKPLRKRTFFKGCYQPHGRRYTIKYKEAHTLKDIGRWSEYDHDVLHALAE